MSGAEIPTLPTMGLATGQVSRLVTELAEAQAAGAISAPKCRLSGPTTRRS
ncbi:hypothetical protein ACFQWF_26505 [Methylorubrum suomiense]